MARENLLTAVYKRPLLCDGAMGTELIQAGLTPGSCGELWNVNRPEAVEAVHRRYHQAGCELLTTNTFGGTRAALARHGVGDRAAELNRAAAQIARRVAGEHAWVLGDIGPFGGFLEPVGDMTAEQLAAMFREQAEALHEGGADALIVETMSDLSEMAIAIRAARAVHTWPVIATYAFGRSPGRVFRTMMGTTVSEAVGAAIQAGADIVGANCGTALSLDDYADLAAEMVASAGKVPVILQPNAGSPQQINGKLSYGATPEDMATLARRMLAAGVRIIGGCCGTGPAHVSAMRIARDERQWPA